MEADAGLTTLRVTNSGGAAAGGIAVRATYDGSPALLLDADASAPRGEAGGVAVFETCTVELLNGAEVRGALPVAQGATFDVIVRRTGWPSDYGCV